MNRADKIKKLLYKTFQEPVKTTGSAAMDQRILSDASTSMKQAMAANQRVYAVSKWRRIMRTRTAQLATAAAILVTAFVLATLDRSISTAWSVEQTIAAIERVKSMQIKGTALWGPDSGSEIVNFNFWVLSPGENSEPLKMRFECEKRIIVVQGNVAYECRPHEKVARIKHGPSIDDLKYWYKAAELSPWLTGKMLETLRLFSDDWNQTIRTDTESGQEQIIVTCSYHPSNTSFSIVIDPKTKLMLKAKLWNNLRHEGEPDVHAQTFIYNEDIPDELFEIPPGFTIVNEKEIEESRALINQGEDLFHKEKKYTEAIAVYQQVYEKYSDMNIAEEALMMIGICHRRLGQREKEIETYEKAVSEYPNLKGWIESTWFYLGRAYMDIGQKEKALDAFEKCLAAGQGVRKPDQFPLKDARECIAEIEESGALFKQGEDLFHKENKYVEAIAVYQQIYDKFPDMNVGEEALMMIGLCYKRLGQHEKEIEAYQKAINEYPNLKGWIESTWFYLGSAYMDIGQKEKALDAFEKCLAAGQGVRKPEQFPLKDAREYIAKIKAEQDSRPSP